MQQFLRLLAVLVLGVVSSEQAQPAQTPPLKTGTTAIVVDVSVLDKRGEPVRDLTAGDFELKENGVRQLLTSARLVDVARPAATNAAPPAAAIAAKPQPSQAAASPPTPTPAPAVSVNADDISVTAILFDRLTPEARPWARRAALAYVATLPPGSGYAGVFMADTTLVTFAPFTNDPARLQTALDRLAVTIPTNLRPEAPDARVGRLLPETPVTAGADTAAGFAGMAELIRMGGRGGDPAASVENALVLMMVRMEKAFRSMLDEMNGQASIAALRATVESLRGLEGRKTILYFSDALPVTARTKSLLETLIVAANTANVTIHTVDSAGLRVHSQEAAVAREMGVAGAQGVGDLQRGDGAWTKELERQEQVVSSRASAVLGRLANETGGFLVANTNDLAAGVPRMQKERDTYYLLTYQPANAVLDGTFRKITVDVKRPQVIVKARKGYTATPPAAR